MQSTNNNNNFNNYSNTSQVRGSASIDDIVDILPKCGYEMVTDFAEHSNVTWDSMVHITESFEQVERSQEALGPCSEDEENPVDTQEPSEVEVEDYESFFNSDHVRDVLWEWSEENPEDEENPVDIIECDLSHTDYD